MVPRLLCLLSGLLLLGPRLCQARPMYLLAAPNILRAGSKENVVVQAQGPAGPLSEDIKVQILLFDFTKDQLLQETSVWLTPANHALAMATVQVPASYSSAGTEKQYVVVQAKFGIVTLEKYVLVSPDTNYIFVQTDKPIYTPGQWVNYRVFSVNNWMDPLETNCMIVIQTPEGITMSSTTRKLEKGLYVGTFHIPEHVSLGTWKILTCIQNSPRQPHSTEFEVKEYVLPSFEVVLTPTRKFFYPGDQSLTVAIAARFVFNEPVDGYALAIFGVRTETQKITLQSSLQRVEINEGRGVLTLRGQDLTSFNKPEDLLDAFIFVNVTVFSSGGEMGQAENSEVKIVNTPYSIRFIRTPGFFKPGMPFSFRVYVTNPDGSPAHDVPVCFRDQKHQTKEGLASMVINTERDSESLQLQVATCGSLAPPAQQANATKTIQAYKTQGSSRHLLHIGVETGTVRVGQPLRITLHPTHKSSAVQHFTILLLSKGRIVRAWTQPHNPDSVMTALTMDVGPQLLPSFRIVAYQYLADNSELVADSLWVDVADECMGTLSVGPQREADKGKVFLPHRQINLQVTGDTQAVVGLVAVDKALFVLNKKNQLTQKKVWDTVERQDIGCTAGSGRDHVGVFTDAGLDLATSLGISTTARTELHCPPTATRRRRRSLQTLQKKKNKVDQYQTALERRCCQAGIQENPMGHSCEQRTSRVQLGPPCVAAFLDCCRFARALNQEERTRLLLGKSSEDEECEDEDCWDSPSVRSYFPESWLWERLVLTQADPLQPGLARHLFSKPLPDSITTWQILAVSLRKDKGICVSEPYEVTVKIPLFVDLRLPFSVVRNEQVALRAVVYNYHEEDNELQVYVMFPYHEQLCSMAKKEKRFQQKLLVPRYSSRAVHFVVVPLELGTIQVEVQAWVRELSFRDTVRKNLNVQAGGEIQRLSRSIILDPKGKEQQALLKSQPLTNQVPDTEAEVFISVQGDILGEMLVGGLQGTTLQKLITLPRGCVEQNIFSVTPNIILTHYLDTTKQWDQIGVERRSQAIQNIIQGYNQQLHFRAQDGSYKPYSGSTGSTWLTAYILKVFAMAASLKTPINHKLLCASAQWLVDQKQDGLGNFCEHAAIYTPAMQGGYQGSNADASLTAFVLIALKEAEPICGTHVNGLSSSLQKAQGYLESHLRRLQNPYSVAISSYALALVNSSMANAVLDTFADVDWTHWAVDKDTARSLYSIEATAYALLQKLTLGHLEKTQAIMQWLIERREFGGGYESTQTTVIGMQALALYRVAVPREKSIDLKVQVTAPTRKLAEQWEINNNNAYLQRSSSKKFNAQDTLNITARGTGTGTVTLLTVYHRLPPVHASNCKAFWLEVTVEDVPEARKKSKYSNTFQLRIRTRSLGLRDATMTIIDISLLTGFEADLDDLKQLTNSVEQYIFLFESKSQLTNNSVILYLNEVSNRTDTEVAFRIHQQLEVGLLQPAVVTVYEYYEPSRRCSRFYMSQHSELLKKICQEQVCKCAEENCLQMSSMRGLEKNALYAKACETGIDYVYKVQLEQQETQGSYVYYSMRVLAVIKAGTDMDVDNKVKRFVSHVACENVLGLREREQYLLMGHTQDLWPTKDSYTYILGKRSFIVPWPKQEEDGADRLRDFQSFSQFVGCDT